MEGDNPMTTTPDHTDSPAGLKQALWRSIKNAIKTPDMWPHEAADVATKVVDGPLDDLSVLVQIPKVRELVESLSMCDVGWQHEPLLSQWAEALEADQ